MADPLPPLVDGEPFMNFRRLFFLRGPNIWSRRQCMEVWVELGPLKDWSSELIPGFNVRYKTWLPTTVEHRCSEGVRGGFFQRLDRGTYLAHILEHTTLELQTLAGCEDSGFGRAREMSEEGVYKVAIRYEEPSVCEACVVAARELLKACVYDLPYDVQSEVARLRDLAGRRLLGPSSKAILAAASARNVPFRRLTMGSLCVLGQGHKQRRIWTAETDRTSAIGESIAQDKALTKRLLSDIGVPVPEGRRVADAEDAVRAAEEIGTAVVVKPVDGNHGRAVIPQLTEPEDIRRAFDLALREGSGVIVERFVPGDEHRLLVVGSKMVAAARGEPISVTADGIQTVEQLIHNVVNADPRRGEDESQPLNPVEIDEALCMALAQQKLNLQSIPAAGREVLIKRYDNLSMDVTEKVHPSVARDVVRAVQMVGLDIAGVDLVACDISRPLDQQAGAIVEVNAGPGLLMHVKPTHGSPQPVGTAIIDHIFNEPGDARIPIITVTGSQHATPVVHAVRDLLASQGHIVGWSDGIGLHMGGLTIDRKAKSTADQIRRLMLNPQVTAVVVAVQPDSILREGLEFDRCNVAIVTDVDWEKHLGGEFDLYNRDKVFSVFRTPVDVILPGGTAILNAADSMALEMKPLSQAGVILYSTDSELDAIANHRREGQAVVVVENKYIIGYSADTVRVLMDLMKYPQQDLNAALASAATAWHLGLCASSPLPETQRMLGS